MITAFWLILGLAYVAFEFWWIGWKIVPPLLLIIGFSWVVDKLKHDDESEFVYKFWHEFLHMNCPWEREVAKMNKQFIKAWKYLDEHPEKDEVEYKYNSYHSVTVKRTDPRNFTDWYFQNEMDGFDYSILPEMQSLKRTGLLEYVSEEERKKLRGW